MSLTLDSASQTNFANGATSPNFSDYTKAFTCTGSSLILCVFIQYNSSKSISSVTYNSVSMSLAKSQVNGALTSAIYYLINPSTGSNNIVVNMSTSGVLSVGGMSFTGANQITGIGATGGVNASSTTKISNNITSTVANSIIVDGMTNNTSSYSGSTPVPKAGQTQEWSSTISSGGWKGASFLTTTTVGSYTTEWDWRHIASVSAVLAQVEIIPATTSTGNFFAFFCP